MLTAEAPYILLNIPQAISEGATKIQESNRRPNVYAYINKNGQLYTPEGGLISRDIRRKTHVEKLEGHAYDDL